MSLKHLIYEREYPDMGKPGSSHSKLYARVFIDQDGGSHESLALDGGTTVRIDLIGRNLAHQTSRLVEACAGCVGDAYFSENGPVTFTTIQATNRIAGKYADVAVDNNVLGAFEAAYLAQQATVRAAATT